MWNTEGGFEFPLVLASIAATLAFTGPGAYSLDAAIEWGIAGVEWGAFAIAFGFLSGFALIVSRRSPEQIVEQARERRAA